MRDKSWRLSREIRVIVTFYVPVSSLSQRARCDEIERLTNVNEKIEFESSSHQPSDRRAIFRRNVLTNVLIEAGINVNSHVRGQNVIVWRKPRSMTPAVLKFQTMIRD